MLFGFGMMSRRPNNGKNIPDFPNADRDTRLYDSTTGQPGAMGGLTADIEGKLIVIMFRILKVFVAQYYSQCQSGLRAEY